MARNDGITEWWQSTMVDAWDSRSDTWLLCSSPVVPFSIVAVYLLLVLKLGPQFMATRKPFKIESIITVYNAAQVVVCAYLFVQGAYSWWFHNYSFLCQPVSRTVNEDTNTIAGLVHAYYILKISDLLDTIFFVLRKKSSQVSFLHVYHHGAMVLAGFIGCKLSPNGHFVMIGILNCFVHAVMYSYYFYTACFPTKKVSLSIKKGLTSLQLVQFCIFTVHTALPLLQPSCGVPKSFCVILVAQYAFMIMMFLDFYKKAYLQPRKKAA